MVKEIGRKDVPAGNLTSDFHSGSNIICSHIFKSNACCSDDMFAQDSIELLQASGIDFSKFENDGIDVHLFGELLTMSGLVLNDDIKWISFHSGYDFGYLVKTLTCTELPAEENAFMDLLYTFFPCIYDIKVGALS